MEDERHTGERQRDREIESEIDSKGERKSGRDAYKEKDR